MPKQTFHINRFEGGMNRDLSPEDIPNNSLLEARGISVSKIGRIIMSGDPNALIGTPSPTVADLNIDVKTAGYGLFPFNSDYDQSNNENATNYLAISNGSNINIYDGSSWATLTGVPFDLGANDTGNDTEPSYYAPNGDLRVCDGKFNDAHNYDNNTKWFGYIPNKTIGTGTADAIIGGWQIQPASIEGGYPKDSSGIATNAMMMDNTTAAVDGDDIYAYTSADSALDWGFNLGYVPASDSATGFPGSTWQPSTNTEYKFYASYVYDGIQEGNPTPLKMYPTLKAYSSRTTAVTSKDAIRFMDTSNNRVRYMHADGDASKITVSTFSDNPTDGSETAAAHGLSASDVVYIDGTTNYEGYHVVSSTNLNTNDFQIDTAQNSSEQYGYVSKVGTNLAVYFAPTFKFNGTDSQDFNFGATATSLTGGNQRITGSRVYWSSSDDGHANLWIMFDANWEKGVKAYGVGKDEPTVTDYIPWENTNDAYDDLHVDLGDFNIWRHPPKYETYESLNGYSHNSKLDAKWKTAVVANGRTYIGNVKRRAKSTFNVNDTALDNGRQDWSSTVKNEPTFGDRILKSPVDRFDTFPEEMAIELFGGDDGDSIIKLETFADRLLVFKKYTLHILNIAKDVEILESSHKGLGLDGGLPCQSCPTSTGVAWINSNGAYHYDGQSIENLSNNKIESFWRGDTSSYIDQDTSQTAFWLSDASDVPSVGYDNDSKKIIIFKTSTTAGDDEEDVLIYDMKIKAWTWMNESLNNRIRTNMVVYKNALIYHDDEGDSSDAFFRYTDTPTTSIIGNGAVGNQVSIVTKPYDFGAPLIRKKVYKIYITYRCNATTDTHVQYYVNGDYNSLYNFTTNSENPFNGDDDNIALDSSVAELDSTAGIWETASLVPATSSQANNIKSFGLKFFNEANGQVPGTFEINDITIIYRNKSVK